MELYATLRLGEKFRDLMELFNVSYGTEQLCCPYNAVSGTTTTNVIHGTSARIFDPLQSGYGCTV